MEPSSDPGKTVFNILSRLNHDLRTPLTAMLNMIGLLKDDPQRHCTPENLRLITEAGEELKQLIQDVTDLARLELGRLALKKQALKLRDLIEERLAFFASLAGEKGVRLELGLDGPLPDRIVADESRLRQVLTLLLANALESTSQGTVTLRVCRGASAGGSEQRLLFSVQDGGPAIPETLQPKIFDLFLNPGNDALVRSLGGHGLGLALSKRLVMRMGGDLGVRASGEGNTFFFDLPCREPDQPHAEAPAERDALTHLGSLRVLVVEDNFINQLSFAQMLERNGFVIRSASNGRQALDMLAEEEFDLVLMDVKMPVMDGLEATRQMRASADPRIRATKVVALTAYAMAEDRARILEAGLDEIVSKPIEVEELANVLSKVLKKG